MIGERVSKYQVIEEIGRGGMGVVYRAHDPQLRRDVALKVLTPERLRDDRRQRQFIGEARAASSLKHPGIVTVFDVVRHENSDVMVMELVEGSSLRAELQRQGTLPWRRAVTIGRRLAAAMAAAHEGGLVHRDLKPENVMLGDGDQLKVLDFGLAKLDRLRSAASAEDVETLVSASEIDLGAGGGTLAYLSPEQALGEAVDGRSDIFAFGIMLFEMLDGRRPFEAATPLASLRARIFDSAGRPKASVPTPLVELLSDCLEKQPDRRPRDFASVLERLEHVESPASDPAQLPQSGLQAPRYLVPLVAASLAVVSVFGIAWWLGAFHATNSTVDPAQNALARPAVVPEAASAYDAYVQGQGLLERYDRSGHVDKAIERLSVAVEKDPELAAAHAALSEAYWRRYRLDNADGQWLERAESHARRAVELADHLAITHLSMARVRVEQDQIDAAWQALNRAAMLEPLHEAIPLVGGRAHERGEHLEEAESSYRRAVELAPGSREAQDSLGSLLFRVARFEEAEAAFRRSIEAAPDSYIGHRNLAAALQMQGHYEEAASSLQRSLAIRPTWSAYNNLGTLQFFRGLFGEAVSAFEKAAELGANDYITWANLGDAYRFSATGKAKAPSAYRRAVQLAREQLEQSSSDVELRSRIALYLAKAGDAEAALAELERTALGGADAMALGRAVSVFELTGRRQQALETLDAALDAGFPLEAIEDDPELEQLRRDVEYHRLLASRQDS